MQKVIERILNLLAFLLTVGRPVTAEEIRFTVKGYDQPSDDAFRRSFERDKDLLRSLGIPLELEPTDIWEVEVGYVIPSDAYTFEDPGLTDEERTALLLAAEAVRFGGQPTEIAAIFKLGGAISPMSTATLVADLGYDLDQLGELFRAVSQRSRLRFDYRGTERVVDPYGLVHRFGRWYIVGPQRGAMETVKVFRADRMTEVRVEEAVRAFTRPDGFDPSSVLASLTQDAEPTKRAEVRFDNDIVGVVLNQFPKAEVMHEDDESTLVSLPLRSDAAFVSWLIGFDDKAVLEAPTALRTQFVDHVGGARGE
jgi:proteasome accessory factor B